MSASPQPALTLSNDDIGTLARASGPWLAVVSSDDSYLSYGGGASSSIWEASGASDARLAGQPIGLPAPLASVVQTDPGMLNASALLHAITIDLDRWRRIGPDEYASMFEALAVEVQRLITEREGAPRRLLMPVIGTDAGGIPEALAAEAFEGFMVSMAAMGVSVHVTGKSIGPAFLDLQERLAARAASHPRLTGLISDLPTPAPAMASALAIDMAGRFRDRLQQAANAAARISTPRGPNEDPADAAARFIKFRCAQLQRSASQQATLDAVMEARREANKVVHARGPVTGLTLTRLYEGISALDALLETPRQPRQQPAPDRTRKETPSEKQPLQPPTQDQERVHRHRSEHVDRMAKLLGELKGEEADDLDRLLDELGYRGTRELKIKEYCTRVDPQEALQRLGAARLRAILSTQYKVSPKTAASVVELADAMLHQLGFHAPQPLYGIGHALAELKRLQHKCNGTGNAHERTGLVLEASQHLERCTRHLLRFMCLHLFDRGPEAHFKGRAKNYLGQPIDSVSLGVLLSLLEFLADKLSEADTAILRQLDGPLTANRLSPGDRSNIARLRNNFAHAKDVDGAPATAPELSKAASEFFVEAIELLAYWHGAKPRVFPWIVRVERITIDKWNRRVIEAIGDGDETERIVSDMPVRAGATYFMYPLSNPFRVDPVLIEFAE